MQTLIEALFREYCDRFAEFYGDQPPPTPEAVAAVKQFIAHVERRLVEEPVAYTRVERDGLVLVTTRGSTYLLSRTERPKTVAPVPIQITGNNDDGRGGMPVAATFAVTGRNP